MFPPKGKVYVCCLIAIVRLAVESMHACFTGKYDYCISTLTKRLMSVELWHGCMTVQPLHALYNN